ncbi:FAD-linked oxidase [Litchfieldella qijiaojingensis]|uniref:FAD-linked oxidase n=1 Tax=Litchfieldella qijiaojingensis TaxID=980347 RepID=A0ABQ2YMW9_9GAMM|nr:FAD-binding oxidoreductase [Halomonas qijiaojingensis]GGX89657.1 FAD-linked oxidase [Halomonas qijiaojingensis]
MIDLSSMRSVRVDPEKKTARVGAGALLGDVDRETQAYGLATPLGINSTTGVAGLCLGGGFGWLTRQHGLTIDNLVSADIVTADGQRHVVSATQEPELFWGIRGGGGNFGIVTSFEFQLHPVGPLIHAGLVVYPFAEAQQVLRAWRDFIANAPRELSVWTVLRQAPPLPFLPESSHGLPVVVFAAAFNGDLEKGKQLTASLLDFGNPLGSALGGQPYADFQTAFDPLLTEGARNYWKSNNFNMITDELIDTLIDSARMLPGPECEIFVAQLGGVAGEIAETDTAYAGRDANFVMNVHGRWRDASEDERIRDWSRNVFRDTAPFATGGGYVNFLTEDETQRIDSAYSHNYARLQQVKQQFDPENLFRMNQNITPATLAKTA